VNEVHFAAPGWIHAFWGVLALVAILLALERSGHAAVERIVGPRMGARLIAAPSAGRRRLGIVLLGLCGGCLVIGLMRPQWGFRHFTAPRVGAEIMVALDVSRSMLAEDVAPSRLARAKAEIADLLTFLDGDQVGLIAFAGRASVLSPLTPDFGFLRMVLDAAGPQSVTRGGTKLAEPIRKAVAGFGPAGEASRAILLITDGEDHDSFALDAAREAAAAGITIITIGFGDEAGSEIPITDARTGARTLLLDGDGRPVRSRLDGDLLREIALATGGAYVPAGTGVLDLESIYERHIARLTRGRLDARGRTVRDEHYQWAVLLGLVFLVSSVLVAAGPVGQRAALAILLLVQLGGAPTSAAEAPQSPQAEESLPSAERDDASAPAQAAKQPEPEPEDPREIYNLGVAALDGGDLEEAKRALARARAEAGTDGELRFRASYNLGMAEAKDAEALEAEEPAEALAGWNRAAAWFREALQQRRDHEDARRNLEVSLRRALLLEDRLAQAGEADVEQELAKLAKRQRDVVAGTALLLGRIDATAASDPHAVDRYRHEFAGQATAQRTLLSEADELAQKIATEWDALQSRAEDQRTPEEGMRAAQLAAVLEHLHGARERMGQARSQLRRRQGERAYRRASAALQELKRARDPLRDPASLLDALIDDTNEVVSATELLAAAGREIPGLDQPLAPPAWLSRETLQEGQTALAERTSEFHARLRAGLASAAPGPDPGPSEMLARVREAEPFVGDARAQLEAASDALESGGLDAARGAQRQALVALLEARERFLDLRRLIEAAYAAQRRIQAVLSSEQEAADDVHAEYLPSLRAAQERNQERARRVEQRLDEEALSESTPGSDGGAEASADDAQDRAERLRLARAALDAAKWAMGDVEHALGAGAPEWRKAASAADSAVSQLEALRRLFFSIAERVRELADRQLDLADATQDAAALQDATPPERQSEALAPRQETLATQAGELALELAAQSDAAAAQTDAPNAAEAGSQLRLAGEHVLAAEDAMKAAVEGLGGEPPLANEAHGHQQEALRELDEALALLAPPQGKQGEDSGKEQSQEGDSGEGKDERAQAAMADPAQLLQAVRDREAQRRSERSRAPSAGYEPVEKDW